MSLLTIYITKSCNLDCGFCINADNMSSDTKMSKDLDKHLEEYLAKNPGKHKLFAISGGEPLIDFDKLSRVLEVILNMEPDAEIMLNTNGTYISSTFIHKINQFPQIKLIISIDGLTAKPRGLLNLLSEEYKGGYETLMLIQRANNKEINFVITREMLNNFNLAFEVLTLKTLFNCKINLSLDTNKESLKSFTIDDIFKVQKFIMRLESLGIYGDNLQFKNMFDNDCNGKNIQAMNWDGSLYHECEHSGYACSYMRSNMKVGFYDLLHKICNVGKFKFDAKLEDKPVYSTDVGFVGKRYTLEPLRKHANFEYKNKNLNIPIKQVD